MIHSFGKDQRANKRNCADGGGLRSLCRSVRGGGSVNCANASRAWVGSSKGCLGVIDV